MTECDHETEMRWRTHSNGTRHVYLQCLLCHDPIGNPIKQASINPKILATLAEFDDQAREEKRKDAQEQWELNFATVNAEKEEKDAEWWRRYNEHLESPKWQRMRRAVIRRDGGICQGCLDAPATQCHHKTYENVCDEFAFELVGLCEDCHIRYHSA